jgi:uncharacterized glyoxalase superfamily protein PhnB
MHSVTPHLVVGGADKAIDFYKKAFDAKEESRMPGPDGKVMHASIRIGDSSVMIMDENPRFKAVGPKTLKGSPVTIHLYVKDADATFNKAIGAGAKTVMPLDDMFWGDRYGVVEDPFGHTWAVATHKRDVSRQEMDDAVKKMKTENG